MNAMLKLQGRLHCRDGLFMILTTWTCYEMHNLR